jgi:DcuC family C4-dicarboxylate transporter
MILLLSAVIIAVAVYAIIRQVDVRLVLLLAALALGSLAGNPLAIVQTFLATLSREQFVLPICCAMGFAYVLRQTQCDQHLIHLLVEPLRRARLFLIPGAVLVGFLVNIPVISQTSTAVAIGSVLVPLLLAARVSPVTTGAALLLGSSLGGELLNPGAPELRTVASTLGISSALCVARVLPLLLVQLAVATILFWALSLRAEAEYHKQEGDDVAGANGTEAPATSSDEANAVPPFRVNLFKAMVPMVPLVLLFLTGPPLNVFQVPYDWLINPDSKSGDDPRNFESRLIGAAMLVGVAVAATTSWRAVPGIARAFFEGAGYAITHIISLIVTAACFGAGIKQIGLAAQLGAAITAWPGLLVPAAGSLPLGFAWVSGSGMAATQSLFEFFVPPAQAIGIDPVHVGAMVSIGAAAGRTLSPVAAVTLMCAALTGTRPFDLIRRLALPLLLGLGAVVLFGTLYAPAR